RFSCPCETRRAILARRRRWVSCGGRGWVLWYVDERGRGFLRHKFVTSRLRLLTKAGRAHSPSISRAFAPIQSFPTPRPFFSRPPPPARQGWPPLPVVVREGC